MHIIYRKVFSMLKLLFDGSSPSTEMDNLPPRFAAKSQMSRWETRLTFQDGSYASKI